jgi:hypothetical protein
MTEQKDYYMATARTTPDSLLVGERIGTFNFIYI